MNLVVYDTKITGATTMLLQVCCEMCIAKQLKFLMELDFSGCETRRIQDTSYSPACQFIIDLIFEWKRELHLKH